MPLLTREVDAPILAHDVEARTVTVQLCRWNDPRTVQDPDGAMYREAYPPGSLELAPDVHVVDVHHGNLIGRADPATYRDGDPGPSVDVVVARTTAGNDLLALVDAGVIRSVSMEIDPVAQSETAPGLITRTRAIVHGLAFAFRPAHDAPILAIREQPTGVAMPITDTPTLEPPADVTPAGAPVTVETLNRELDVIRREIIAAPSTTYSTAPHPLALYRSLGDAVFAATNESRAAGAREVVNPDSVQGLLHRALVDQITPNNPGVMPPSWVTTVFGIIDRGRPTISAFGVDSAGDSGMEINWPYFDGDLMALVAVQVAQKTPITSVRVDLKKGTEDLLTYAGGSDVAWQLLRRSSPSYRDAYMRIMYGAYSAVTNAAAAVAIVAGQAVAYDAATDTDGSKFRAALFEASVLVEAATGAPASFVLAATDVFVAVGGQPTVFPSNYGTTNVGGTADAGSLRVNVSGIDVIHDASLPAGQSFVSNSTAASWYEDGPFSVVAEDVEKLGQNIAVWGLGAFGIHLPMGIVELNALGVPSALGAGSSSSRSKAAK
jgi:hypothetical protein